MHRRDVDGYAWRHDYARAAKFSNAASVGKNLNFNQVRGRFTLPPPSLFFNYALLLLGTCGAGGEKFCTTRLRIVRTVGSCTQRVALMPQAIATARDALC